jgi:hypothetical protein
MNGAAEDIVVDPVRFLREDGIDGGKAGIRS